MVWCAYGSLGFIFYVAATAPYLLAARIMWKEGWPYTGKGGGLSVRGASPLQVVYRECGASRSLALKREGEIKRLGWQEKLMLIENGEII